MKNIFFKPLALLSMGVLAMTGCTSTFEEVNTDPDRPNADLVSSTNILAYVERYASDNMFDEWFDLNEVAGFSGQVAKAQYTEEGYYDFRPSVNNSSWNTCYVMISNLNAILNKEEQGSNMWAVATIMQCQIWQIATDRWGNIPYSEALQLESENNTTPVYDKQSVIYPDLLRRLKQAADALDPSGDRLGDGDVLLNGSISGWKRYANSLRLRIAARIANVAPNEAQTVFAEVASNPANFVSDNKFNVFFEWKNEYPEPYADYYQTRPQEYAVSTCMITELKKTNDPRLEVYAEPTISWTSWDGTGDEPVKYNGYQVGTKAYGNVSNLSRIGNRFMNGDGLDGFSPWLRACESYFAIAYAASKGWNVGMTQKEAYEKAVALSLEENDCDGTFLSEGGAYDGSLEQLMTQWWISVYKNGSEAWSVYRMAGYPTSNVIAPDSYYPGHNCPPMCYGYPDNERNLNTENCKAEASAEKDYFWGKQMWWDTRTGLQ